MMPRKSIVARSAAVMVEAAHKITDGFMDLLLDNDDQANERLLVANSDGRNGKSLRQSIALQLAGFVDPVLLHQCPKLNLEFVTKAETGYAWIVRKESVDPSEVDYEIEVGQRIRLTEEVNAEREGTIPASTEGYVNAIEVPSKDEQNYIHCVNCIFPGKERFRSAMVSPYQLEFPEC